MWYLVAAILCEMTGTSLMRLAGVARWWPYYVVVPFCYLACLACLFRALVLVEFSLIYAVWSGLGMLMSLAVGALLFGEALTGAKLMWTGVTFAGILGLLFHEG